MSIAETVALYFIALTAFLVIDLTWLGVVAKDMYAKELKKWLPKKFDLRKAFAFYLVYIVGVLAMVLVPAINDQSLAHAMVYGAMFGFFTYATYDLTNYSTIKDWPLGITIKDLFWGTFLGWSVSTISYSVYSGIFF